MPTQLIQLSPGVFGAVETGAELSGPPRTGQIEPDWQNVRRGQWAEAAQANARMQPSPMAPQAAKMGLRGRDLLSLRGAGPLAVLSAGANEIYKGLGPGYTPTEEYAARFGQEPAGQAFGPLDALGPLGWTTSAALGQGGEIGQRMLGIADDALMGAPSAISRMLRGLGGGDEIDAVLAASPRMQQNAPEPQVPQQPKAMYNQGLYPDLPEQVMPDYGGFAAQVAGLGPQSPNTSMLDNPPQRGGVVRPDQTGRQAEMERMKNSAPEAPTGMSTTEKIVQALGTMAAGALRGDGSLRSTLANTGPMMAQMVLSNAANEKAENAAYQQALAQHESAVNRMTQDQADYEAQLNQLDSDIVYGNETTRYEAQLQKQEILQRSAEAQRGHQIKIAELGMRAQEAQANFINDNLDRQFEHQMAKMKFEAPKVSIVDGNYMIQRVDENGDVFFETKPVGAGGRGLKDLLALNKNENLSPTVSRKVQKMAEFSAAAEIGDVTLMIDSLADDIVQNTPNMIEGYSDKAELAREQAQQMGALPGTPEFEMAVRDILTGQVAADVMAPGVLQELAKTNPYAKALMESLRAANIQ